MTKIIPTPKQQEFLSSNADVCLMGGGAGSAKSFALLLDSLGLNDAKFGPRYRLPYYRALIYRKQFKHLNDLIDKSKNMFPLFDKGAIFTSTNMTWRFSSGAEIQFMYFEDMSQVEAIQGRELAWIGCDELGQYKDDKIFRYCLSRLRSSQGLKCYYRCTSNPSRYRFIRDTFKINDKGDSTSHIETYTLADGSTVTRKFQYLKAMLYDNPHLGNDYEAQLMLLPDDERRALLEGDWAAYDITEASVYANEYRQLEKENRITTVRYQPGFDVYAVFDLGFGDYTSVIIFQICGKEYQIIESFESNGKGIDWYISEVKGKGYQNIKYILPHDAKQGSIQTGITTEKTVINMVGESNVSVLEKLGIRAGIDQVRRIFPYMYVDKTKNENLIEAMKCYEYEFDSRRNVYGSPKHDQFSHMADALRYMCAYIVPQASPKIDFKKFTQKSGTF